MIVVNKTSEIIAEVQKQGRKFLLEPEAKTICMEYSIPVTKFTVAKSPKEAVEAAENIGYPVVLKIVSPDVVHKSDVGGVVLNLRSSEEVEKAYQQIIGNVKKHKPNAQITGVLVQEMAPSSTEIIVGVIKDPQFGHAIMFGLGGIFVELLKDVAFRLLPLTKEEAEEMITEIKAYPVLKGYRKTPPADIPAIIEILLNTSRLVTEHPEIQELDLNPIMVYTKGAKTVDARIILE
ncbi:MAG TPA: acetyl-CoA synthetase [Candidatus Bathyarchaeota archaeon]|nr:acetyl-CoA synthetase [Candidatus Bathyarchaeota archaeon]